MRVLSKFSSKRPSEKMGNGVFLNFTYDLNHQAIILQKIYDFLSLAHLSFYEDNLFKQVF